MPYPQLLILSYILFFNDKKEEDILHIYYERGRYKKHCTNWEFENIIFFYGEDIILNIK